MTSPAELALLIRQTRSFRDADAEEILVTSPVSHVPDGAGGFVSTSGVPFTETVRLIPQSDKVPVTTTWEGSRATVEYILLSTPDTKDRIAKGALFDWRGRKWRVAQVHDKPDYEFKADVILNVG